MNTDLRGRPLRDLRISVTDRCTFRCVYCMPREQYDGHQYLPRSEILTFDEIATVVRAAVSLGVSKVRLTGGEPLLRRDVTTLVAMIASIDGVEDLAMTTNAHLLEPLAADLARAGLDRITISLDGLDDDVVSGLIDTDVTVATVLAAIEAAERSGLDPIKINTVVLRGANEHQVVPLLEHFRFSGHTVRFIEYMDVGTTNRWDVSDVVSSKELIERISDQWPVEPIGRAHASDVADRYRFIDGGGEIGFISSVSSPFCGDCARMRLSAEGSVYTCLFATTGTDVKAVLRSGGDEGAVADVMAAVWRTRDDRYSEVRGGVLLPDPRVEMSYIGG